MQCDRCGSEQFTKAGRDRQARQLYRCTGCGRRITERSTSAFSGYRFPDDIIALAVRWSYAFRAIDEDGQVIDVSISPTRDTAAATAFLTRAVESTAVTPTVATTDKAAIYPPALATVLPEVKHIAGKLVHQRIERDHQHLKGRTRSMRGFQTLPCAQVICAGHAFMRNLRGGFYDLGVPGDDPRLHQPLRLVRVSDELTIALTTA